MRLLKISVDNAKFILIIERDRGTFSCSKCKYVIKDENITEDLNYYCDSERLSRDTGLENDKKYHKHLASFCRFINRHTIKDHKEVIYYDEYITQVINLNSMYNIKYYLKNGFEQED